MNTAPITAAPLEAHPELVSLTRAAAAWAAGVAQATDAAVSPAVKVTVTGSDGSLPRLYTEAGISSDGTWQAPLLAPTALFTGQDGDACVFPVGIRGPQSHLSALAEAARTEVLAATGVSAQRGTSFSRLLDRSSCAFNVWRYGPGALAIDAVVAPGYAHYHSKYVVRFEFVGCTAREVFVVLGADNIPSGGSRAIRIVSETEAELEIDLRGAYVDATTFIRAVVVWETPVLGTPRQCLVAVRAPVSLPAVGAVYAGGSVLGVGAYSVDAGVVASFARASLPGVVACSSPAGPSVFAAQAGSGSDYFYGDAAFTLKVDKLALQSSSLLFAATVVPVGDGWRGDADAKSTVQVEVDTGSGQWLPLSGYSFSHAADARQSFPSRAGIGESSDAGTGALFRDAYWFLHAADTPGVVRKDSSYRLYVPVSTTSAYVAFRLRAGRPFVVTSAQVWGQSGARLAAVGSDLGVDMSGASGSTVEPATVRVTARDTSGSALVTIDGQALELVERVSLAANTAASVVWSVAVPRDGDIRAAGGAPVSAIVSGLQPHNRIRLSFVLAHQLVPALPGAEVSRAPSLSVVGFTVTRNPPTPPAAPAVSTPPSRVVPRDPVHNWGPDYIPPFRGRIPGAPQPGARTGSP